MEGPPGPAVSGTDSGGPRSPVTPHNATDGVVATDITAAFKAACAELALHKGDMVKDDFFTLFGSISALEIMDPKMDSGCVMSEEELEEAYDAAQDLTAAQVIGIMDQLLSLEMAWHLGYSLSQTLLTSVYIEAIVAPDNIVNGLEFRNTDETQEPLLAALRAYCDGVIKSSGRAIELVKSERYYEEEDFVTHTYHRSLHNEVDGDTVVSWLRKAHDALQPSTPTESGEIAGIKARLQTRAALLEATDAIALEEDVGEMQAMWQRGIDALELIVSSHTLAAMVPEAFSGKLQKRLASNMPPRPIVQLQFGEAIGHFGRLFRDGLEATNVLNYTDSQCLVNFVATFHAKEPQKLVFTRAIIQHHLFHEMRILRTMSLRQVLDDDFSIVCMPASPLFDQELDDVPDEGDVPDYGDPRPLIARRMEQFRKRAADPFVELIGNLCQNRCRVRRNLCNMVQEWESLQVEAEQADLALELLQDSDPTMPPPLLTAWVVSYKLRQLAWIVQHGFELQVYQPDELAGTYWHLNLISRERMRHINATRTSMFGNASTLDRIRPGAERQTTRTLYFTRLSMLEAGITYDLSDGLSSLYAALYRLDLIPRAKRPCSTDEMRYELRMRPFTAVSASSPSLVPTFEAYTMGWERAGVGIAELLVHAKKSASDAKDSLGKLSQLPAPATFSAGCEERWQVVVKNWLRSAIAAGIAATAVEKAVRASGEGARGSAALRIQAEVPTPAKAYHEWWIAPAIKLLG